MGSQGIPGSGQVESHLTLAPDGDPWDPSAVDLASQQFGTLRSGSQKLPVIPDHNLLRKHENTV